MTRTIVITGAGSGMGQATAQQIASSGDIVIGVDLRNADIIADLATAEGRSAMINGIKKRAPHGIDGVIAAAGIAGVDQPALTISINFFGAVATLEGLRPLMRQSKRPRAVAVLSTAALQTADAGIVEACLAGDEAEALKIAQNSPETAYAASKKALTSWLRRVATTAEWAGTGILLNGVAPGTVITPMTAKLLATEEGRESLAKATPIAVPEYGKPDELAKILQFLVSDDASYIVGQVLFIDGGTDALTRPKHY